MIEVTLPIPPSINSMYSQSRSGHRFKTSQAKKWDAGALWALKKVKERYDCPVEVAIYFYFEDKRPDIDSKIKCLLDVFQKAGILKNDRLVYSLLVTKDFDKLNPRVEVRIRPLA